jgi:hypothetical protein
VLQGIDGLPRHSGSALRAATRCRSSAVRRMRRHCHQPLALYAY